MPARARFRRRSVALVTAAVVVGVALSVGLVTALPSGGSDRAGPPAAEDVAAARACAAFSSYLDEASKGEVPQAVGQRLAQTAGQLIAGAAAAQKAGRPLPKWTRLGEALVAAGDDIVHRNSATLQQDGTAAAQICHTIPAAARQAGGYLTSGS